MVTSTATINRDIFILNETWLDSGINSVKLGSPNFNTYRVDRNSKTNAKTRWGGVATVILKIFSFSNTSTKFSCIKQLFVKVNTSSGKIIAGCYSNYCDEVESIVIDTQTLN